MTVVSVSDNALASCLHKYYNAAGVPAFMTTYPRIVLLLSLLAAIPLCQAPGQVPDMTPGTIQYPQAMPLWKVKMSVGLTAATLPEDIVEEASAIRWPLFGFDLVMGLPENFLMEGKVNTEFITNHFQLGAKWVYGFTDRLHAAAGLDVAYWFGWAKVGVFNNTAHGWFTYPNVVVGYDFGVVALTVTARLNLLNTVSFTSDQAEVTSSFDSRLNGFSYFVYLEQPLWKDNTVGLSFGANYVKFFYPDWLLFAAFDRYYWIPEFQVWFTL